MKLSPLPFEDPNRTVIGYHGTRRSVALQVVQKLGTLKSSSNRDDWLGAGVYYWEHAPKQAWWWAQRRRKRQKWNEEPAVVASMIRLGNCWDLLDPTNVRSLKAIHEIFIDDAKATGREVKANANHHKYLDCAIFRYAQAMFREQGVQIDTCRGVYVPTHGNRRVWTRSWIIEQAHIQLCVWNPKCILGTWLIDADGEELEYGEKDQNTNGHKDSEGRSESEEETNGRED